MLSLFANRTYTHLFLAQILSLLGTGLTTVALGLLAYDLAGKDAGLVLGTAFAVKMVAYVSVAPIAASVAERIPRRRFLVLLDLLRAGMVVFLPFVTEVWQIYVLIFAFQSCSAAFTPTFQATIPDVLDDEAAYTRALSLSRLAYDMEALLSPVFAGLLLSVVSFHWLFVGNAMGFLASAALILTVVLPLRHGRSGGSFTERVTRGVRIYLATPRLRGTLALCLVVAAAGSMVLVNTVVLVRDTFAGSDQDVALFLSVFGLGSMVVAVVLPRVLARVSARTVMICGGGLLVAALWLAPLAEGQVMWLAVWAVLGAGLSLIQTPVGLMLRRSSHAEDQPAVFAAQFALSHGCWLLAYPSAGWLGAEFGLTLTFQVMAVVTTLATASVLLLWPARDPEELWHEHAEVTHVHNVREDGHHEGEAESAHTHAAHGHCHKFVIDDHHRRWPKGQPKVVEG